ncbi:MAG: regulatory protein RecX [Ardenticatenia bacterium]|nr:regulatory protein RecX [Ardenticatenia bacterium]
MSQRRITKVEIDPRRPRWARVHVEGRSPMRVPSSVVATLCVGQALSPEEVARLEEASRTRRALEVALRLLARRDRSTAEIERHLQNRGFPASTVAAVVAILTERGWLDDRKFARRWVENRLEHRPRGRLALAHELRRKGVNASHIEAALAELPDEESIARRAAERFMGRLASVEDYHTFARRLSAYLARRGFGWDTIRPVVDALWAERGQR